MYYPYFRGKQFELITVRETALLMAESGFVPIIEPVKETLNQEVRALKAVLESKGNAIVVVNPDCGDHAFGGDGVSVLLKSNFSNNTNISAGILLRNGADFSNVTKLYEDHVDHDPVFIHAGYSDPKRLAEWLANQKPLKHVFFEKTCGKMYRKNFSECQQRILLRDGFVKRRSNSEYPFVEEFSDLHLTYNEEGMNGFGDFLMVGDEFSEGGPAYAVAIHLTFIDPDQDDVMFIYHFLSTTNNTPTDPAGKFGQALGKLIGLLDSGESKLFEGGAIKEFRSLHKQGHFPGLGYVKKLSMKHHLETLANFIR